MEAPVGFARFLGSNSYCEGARLMYLIALPPYFKVRTPFSIE
jgi:hypothetical protein